MTTRTKLAFDVGVSLAILCGGFFIAALPWMLARRVVEKLLNDPTTQLSQREFERVCSYIHGDSWSRPPFIGLTRKEEAKLVDSAIARAAGTEKCGVLMAVADAWSRRGAFPSLPKRVNDALLRGSRHWDSIFNTVGGTAGRGALDPYIDVDFALKSDDQRTILACVLGLEMRTLLKHREGCLDMLRRRGAAIFCKRAFLKRVAGAELGATWFGGEEQLLQSLQCINDKELNGAIDKIEQQLRGKKHGVGESSNAP